MDLSRPDVVFDCNVFLQAITRATGPASAALRMVEQNRVTLHTSKAILRELRRTLTYPEIRQKNPHVTDQVIAAFIGRILFRSALARDVPHMFHYARDPDDEPYMNLAAAVEADFLVTRDQDLLSLTEDHSIEGKQFRQRLPSLRIVNPVDFLRVMESWPAPQGPPPA